MTRYLIFLSAIVVVPTVVGVWWWYYGPAYQQSHLLADAEKAVQAIMGAARTGKIGDGKVFLSKVDDVIRIRNEERGEGAL